MSEFTNEQYKVILMAIKENKFLSGNYKIYKFPSEKAFDAIIEELLSICFIDYKNPPVRTKVGGYEFYDKEYKITKDGIHWLENNK